MSPWVSNTFIIHGECPLAWMGQVCVHRHKKLCYLRRTARRDGVIELEGYSRPTCNKQCESGHRASTVIGVIHKLDRRRVLLTCCGEIFKVHSYAYFPLLSLVIVRARLLSASYNK